jgi:PleD family two-component response regulator
MNSNNGKPHIDNADLNIFEHSYPAMDKVGISQLLSITQPSEIAQDQTARLTAIKARLQPRLMVVESDETISDLLRTIFVREGFDVIRAFDGYQAMMLMNNLTAPRLIIMDIVLPYINGFQLIKQIRNKRNWRNVPITILSARSIEQEIALALQIGADDYVLKPFQPRELVARVLRFLSAPIVNQPLFI